MAHAAAGDRAGARSIVQDLERSRSVGELVPPMMIAAGYGALGDATRGLEWFDRGIDERDIYIPENFFEPFLDSLRSDPGFGRIVRRMGLDPSGGP